MNITRYHNSSNDHDLISEDKKKRYEKQWVSPPVNQTWQADASGLEYTRSEGHFPAASFIVGG